MLSFGDATTIQTTALRGHPVPHFKWYQQPIRICNSGCKPDAKKWRRVPRHVIDPSEKVPSRISSLFLPPAKSGYFFRCIAENFLGHDDAVFSVLRVGKFTKIDTNFTAPEFLTSSFFCVLRFIRKTFPKVGQRKQYTIRDHCSRHLQKNCSNF